MRRIRTIPKRKGTVSTPASATKRMRTECPDHSESPGLRLEVRWEGDQRITEIYTTMEGILSTLRQPINEARKASHLALPNKLRKLPTARNLMLLMYTTASRKMRHQYFEAFWYTYHLAFFFMIGLYSRVLIHPSGAMELRIVKPSFKYTPGQWLFIQVPEISRFQWHPFTITSAPRDPYISVHIRQVGDFTHALGEFLGAGPNVVARMTAAAMQGSETEKNYRISRGDFIELDPGLGAKLPAVRIDGPFGAPAEDVFNLQVAVLVGGGIGVTPFASILKDIYYQQRENRLGLLQRVEFFWICRDAPSFDWFQSILSEVEAAQSDSKFLRISIYLTQKISEDMLWNIAINDAGAEYDPLTLLRTRTLFGRPDWTSIYSRLRWAIENGGYLPGSTEQLKTKVGTYFYGPGAIGKDIKAATVQNGGHAVEFSFAKEHF